MGKFARNNLSVSLVKNGKFTVYGEKDTEFYWIVYGKRKSITVEPNKENINIRGNGPYTWY